MDEVELRRVTPGEPDRLDGPVALVQHDPRWPELYAREAARIRAALGLKARRIEDVGSTAEPGLITKTLIDVALGVEASPAEAAYLPALEAAGYVLRIREPDWHQHRLLNGPDTG